MTKEEMQKYWDACLIKQWRLCGTLGNTYTMYKSIVGRYPNEGELFRLPGYMNHSIGVRVFVDAFLPKLSALLWKVPPEKDVEILRKLTKTKYDNDKRQSTDGQRARNNERERHRRNEKKVNFNTESFENRNNATDWGVVKSSKAKVRRKR